MTKETSRETGTPRFLRVIAKTLYVVALAALVALVAGIIVLKVSGTSTLTVLTPSMEPSLMTGDVILVRPVNSPIEIGNVYVGFSPEINALLAHRVVGEGATPGTWVTKGDANSSEDTYQFSSNELTQEVVGRIPFLGNVTGNMTRMGVIALLFLLGGAVYFWVLHALKDEDSENEDDGDSERVKGDSEDKPSVSAGGKE